jgi:hypothetical protein
MYHYAYLIGLLILLFPIWLVCLVIRKDSWKEVLSVSVVASILAVVTSLWYQSDYWYPPRLFNSPIPIEDPLFGFFIGGINSVLYSAVFKKAYKPSRIKSNFIYILIACSVAPIIIMGFLINLGMNSMYASLIGCFLVIVYILYKRRDLIAVGLSTAVLSLLVVLVTYSIFLTLFPGAIQQWWFLENLSGYMFLKVPIEEYLWGFEAAVFFSILYKYSSGRILS